jgi:c-di-GMP-related signal transduction protein
MSKDDFIESKMAQEWNRYMSIEKGIRLDMKYAGIAGIKEENTRTYPKEVIKLVEVAENIKDHPDMDWREELEQALNPFERDKDA